MKPQQLRPDSTVFQSIAIILVGLFISISILIASGAATSTLQDFVSALPKFASYQDLKEINDYSNPSVVFAGQPKISYNTNAKLLFVENSDMNCVNCANFNGYNSSNNNYPSYKLKKEFIETGKMDYIFVDTLVFDSVSKHNAAYCVAEQSSEKYFQFKDKVYKNYGKTFDLDAAKNYVRDLRIDNAKFEECYSSGKYNERVNSLSQFAGSQLSTSSTPTFHVFKVEEQEVLKSDGSKVKEKVYTKLTTIVGNKDYNVFMKPELDRIVEANK